MPKLLVTPSPQLRKPASEWLLNGFPGRLCHGLPLSITSSYRRHDYILQHHKQQGSSTPSWAFMTYHLSSDTRCTKSAPKQTHSELSARSCQVSLAQSESAFMHSYSDPLGLKDAKKGYRRQTLVFAESPMFHFVLRLEGSLTEMFPHSLSPIVRDAQLLKWNCTFSERYMKMLLTFVSPPIHVAIQSSRNLLQHCVVVTPHSGKLLLRTVANGLHMSSSAFPHLVNQ